MCVSVAVITTYCFFFCFISQQPLHDVTCLPEYFNINLTNLVQGYSLVCNLSLSHADFRRVITAFAPVLVPQFALFVFLMGVCVPAFSVCQSAVICWSWHSGRNYFSCPSARTCHCFPPPMSSKLICLLDYIWRTEQVQNSFFIQVLTCLNLLN